VAVVQIKAGGEGISLVEARYCVFYSTGFGLGAIMQARKRVHRPGQNRKVTYYHLLAAGTIDQKIRRATEKQEDLVRSLVDRRTIEDLTHDYESNSFKNYPAKLP
jgi:SNF2 family DNA or RNA helicase